MSLRNKLDQYRQIRGSYTYNDVIPNINTELGAQSTLSLEEDLNNIRTILKQIKGTSHWYDASANISELSPLLDKKVINFTQLEMQSPYKVELPLELNYVQVVQIVDSNKNPILTNNEEVIFARITPNTNVLEFFSISGPYIGTIPNNIVALIPYEVALTDDSKIISGAPSGFSNYIGSTELGNREFINNEYFSIPNNTNITSVINNIINSATPKLEDVDRLIALIDNNEDTDYAENYVKNTDTIVKNIGTLDIALKNVENEVRALNKVSYVEIIQNPIPARTIHTLPSGAEYNHLSKYSLTIYSDGVRLFSDELKGDGLYSGDFSQISDTSIAFNFDVLPGDVFIYEIIG